MSLLNAWVLPEQALVAVDTEGRTLSDSARQMSKLALVPHLNVVLAARGSAAFLAGVTSVCLASGGDHVDELLAAIPEILRFVALSTPAQLHHPEFPDLELLVTGWSETRGQMVARIYRRTNGAKAFEGRDSVGCLAPYDAPSMDGLARTPENLPAIARAQVHYLRSHFSLGGGELLVARASRDEVTLRRVAAFNEEATHADTRPAA